MKSFSINLMAVCSTLLFAPRTNILQPMKKILFIMVFFIGTTAKATNVEVDFRGIDIPADFLGYVERQAIWGTVLASCLLLLIGVLLILSKVVKAPSQRVRFFTTIGSILAIVLPGIYSLVPLIYSDTVDSIFLYFMMANVLLAGFALGLSFWLRAKNRILLNKK
jgi:hypothetical protein